MDITCLMIQKVDGNKGYPPIHQIKKAALRVINAKTSGVLLQIHSLALAN